MAAAGSELKGVRDESFGTKGSFSLWRRKGEHRFKAVVVAPDGAIYALGHAPFDTGRDMALVRITDQGKLDEGFGTRGVLRLGRHRTFGEDVALDTQGRIVATGYFYAKGGTRSVVARATSAGKLDPKFGRGGLVVHNSGSDNRAQQLHVRADGSLLISGYHAATENQVFCLQDSGAPCSDFGKGGVAAVTAVPGQGAFATRSALHGKGGIVLGGYLPRKKRMFVSRVTARGKVDASFGSGGTTVLQDVPIGSAWALAVDARQRVLLSGHAPSGPIVVARFSERGKLDTSFGRNGVAVPLGADDQLYSLLPQKGGGILGVGFRGIGDSSQPLFVLLTSGGKVERTAWVDEAAPRPSFVFGAAVDAKGRVLVAGDTPGDRWSAWIGRYR